MRSPARFPLEIHDTDISPLNSKKHRKSNAMSYGTPVRGREIRAGDNLLLLTKHIPCLDDWLVDTLWKREATCTFREGKIGSYRSRESHQ